MKRWFTASILTLGLSISVYAADSTPTTLKGEVNNPMYAGRSTCLITNSTGTSNLLCTTGSGIILQVIGSSVAATDYLTFRDTATANGSSTELMRVSQGNLAGVYVYPRFKNGLCVTASAAAPATSGAWTIIYTKDLN